MQLNGRKNWNLNNGYEINHEIGYYLVLLFGLQKCLYNDPRELNVEFVPEMVHSVPFDAFAENPNYSNGQTLQMPVEGTIARGFLLNIPMGNSRKN